MEGLWGRLGDARLVAGDAEGAAEAYRKMLAEAADSARVRYNLGTALRRTGTAPGGDCRVPAAFGKSRLGGRGRAALGRSALGSRGSGEAEQLLRDLLERQPEARSVLWSLGGLLFRAERYSESLACFERLRALDQEDYRVYFLLAKLYGRTGREAEGLEALAAYERGRRTAQVHERMEEEIEGLLRNILK